MSTRESSTNKETSGRMGATIIVCVLTTTPGSTHVLKSEWQIHCVGNSRLPVVITHNNIQRGQWCRVHHTGAASSRPE